MKFVAVFEGPRKHATAYIEAETQQEAKDIANNMRADDLNWDTQQEVGNVEVEGVYCGRCCQGCESKGCEEWRNHNDDLSIVNTELLGK